MVLILVVVVIDLLVVFNMVVDMVFGTDMVETICCWVTNMVVNEAMHSMILLACCLYHNVQQ